MLDLATLHTTLLSHACDVVDSEVIDYIIESINKDLRPIENDKDAWRKLSMLWPPENITMSSKK
jgi:hypothetical protein